MSVTASRAHLSNVEFYNLTVHSLSSRCSRWNTISFELADTDAVNVQIRNSTFNRTVSLTDGGSGSTLSSGYRYWIHNNIFDEASGNNYAIELDNNNSIIETTTSTVASTRSSTSPAQSGATRSTTTSSTISTTAARSISRTIRSGTASTTTRSSCGSPPGQTSSSEPEASRSRSRTTSSRRPCQWGTCSVLLATRRSTPTSSTSSPQGVHTRSPRIRSCRCRAASRLPSIPPAGSPAVGLGAFSNGTWSVGTER